MNKTLLILLLLTFSAPVLKSQVAINSDGSTADPSAILDVKSTEMGFLPPRMSEVEKLRIALPAEGLIIYNTTSGSIQVFTSSGWLSYNEDGLKRDPLLYQVAIGGTGDEEAYGICELTDGSIVVAGYTDSYGVGNDDVYIVKLNNDFILDSSFNNTGTLTLGGANIENAYAVAPAHDAGVFVAGSTQSFGSGGWEMYLAKITELGTLATPFGSNGTRTIGNIHNERSYSMQPVSDGGYILSGYHVIPTVTSNYEGYMVKFTSTGALDNTFGTNGTLKIGGNGVEYFMTVKETADNGFIAVGQTTSYDVANYDMYAVKVTSTGALDNSFGVNGTFVIGGSGGDYARDVVQTADGGYLIIGQTTSYGAGDSDIYFVKLTSSGTLDNSFGINGTMTAGGSGFDAGRCILLETNGSFIIGGYTNSFGAGGNDMYVMKCSPSGIPDSTFGINGFVTIGGEGDEELYSMCASSESGYLLAGTSTSFGSGGHDFYIVRINIAGGGCGNTGSGGSITGSGGTVNSGGNVSGGGSLSSGGTVNSGGSLTSICE